MESVGSRRSSSSSIKLKIMKRKMIPSWANILSGTNRDEGLFSAGNDLERTLSNVRCVRLPIAATYVINLHQKLDRGLFFRTSN